MRYVIVDYGRLLDVGGPAPVHTRGPVGWASPAGRVAVRRWGVNALVAGMTRSRSSVNLVIVSG